MASRMRSSSRLAMGTSYENGLRRLLQPSGPVAGSDGCGPLALLYPGLPHAVSPAFTRRWPVTDRLARGLEGRRE